MRKGISAICCATALMMALGVGNAFAATSKATCGAGPIAVVTATTASVAENQEIVGTPIFSETIHTAQQKDLFVDVSLECGLTTNTKVMSKALQRDIAEAEAFVEVWVEVDGVMAEPGVVTFARRYQSLIAEFAGSFETDGLVEECFVPDDDDPDITIVAEDCLTEEMVALILDTMTANSFNFIVADLDAGDHDVVVYANVGYNATSELLDVNIPTNAYLGKGSVTVESVRLVKDEAIEID